MKNIFILMVGFVAFFASNCVTTKIHTANVGSQKVYVAEKETISLFGSQSASAEECIAMLEKDGVPRLLLAEGEWKNDPFYSVHSSATTDMQGCRAYGVK